MCSPCHCSSHQYIWQTPDRTWRESHPEGNGSLSQDARQSCHRYYQAAKRCHLTSCLPSASHKRVHMHQETLPTWYLSTWEKQSMSCNTRQSGARWNETEVACCLILAIFHPAWLSRSTPFYSNRMSWRSFVLLAKGDLNCQYTQAGMQYGLQLRWLPSHPETRSRHGCAAHLRGEESFFPRGTPRDSMALSSWIWEDRALFLCSISAVFQCNSNCMRLVSKGILFCVDRLVGGVAGGTQEVRASWFFAGMQVSS